MLDNVIPRDSNTKLLLDKIEKGGKYTVFGFSRAEKLFLTHSITRPVLYIAQDEQDAKNVLSKMTRPSAMLQSILYPSIQDKSSIYQDTISKIYGLNSGAIEVLVAYPEVLHSYYQVSVGHILLTIDEEYDPKTLLSSFVSFGYRRVESVNEKGDVSLHGDSMDIYLDQEETILRLSFFDTTLESITKYSPLTFEKLESLTAYEITSNTLIDTKNDILFDKINQDIDASIKKCKLANSLDNLRTLQSQVESDRLLHDVGHEDYYLPYLESVTLWDMLARDVVILFDEHKMIYDKTNGFIQKSKSVIDDEIKMGQYLPAHKNLLCSMEQLVEGLKEKTVLAFGNLSSNNRWFVSNAVFHIKTLPIRKYIDQIDELAHDLANYLRSGYEVVVFGKTEDYLTRIAKRLDGYRVSYKILKTLRNCQHGHIHLVAKEYPVSFGLLNEKLIVIGSDHLFATKPKKTTSVDTFIDLPEVGDFVVHASYGIARYDGNMMLKSDNGQKEYLVLKYKNDDTVYLPVENLDRLSKYLGGKENPQLSKLGTGEFLKVKAKVKSSLKELAFSLVELYKARNEKKGIVYPRDSETESLLDTNFAYTLTEDQQKAILDVYEDMASGRIMERLICGDVGFGKTEVAIRAILKTVLNGYQVAFLCPTTILSEQHYQTCLDRLSTFGVRIGVLNRFKTAKEQKALLEEVKAGRIDVLIGTHRLLSSDVTFSKLGMLVLDEEQKFGVGDKEKIKNLKKDINVLTLSATPIPRTLHMSLIGVRDISMIEIPPMSRKDSITQVVEFSEAVIKSAVEKEMARGGQTLIVYNYVQSMPSMVARLKQLLGDHCRVDMAHGQMEEKMLENAIIRLYNKETDVMLASTLIENGIDLPSANTLIVIDSQNLGLSQLYQLKGRVGRSDKQAYAYFMYQKDGLLTSSAYKRLEAIGQYSAMGSGYKIALRDLEIRGAGNVLGVEQSGHMGKVGYHMYMTLLQEAITELQGQKVENMSDCTVSTTLDGYLPQSYVEEETERIVVYSRIAKIKNEEDRIQLLEYLAGRYGDVPSEVDNLIWIAMLKNWASKLGITKVVVRATTCQLLFSLESDNKALLNLVEKYDMMTLDMSSQAKVVIDLDMGVKEKIVALVRLLSLEEV